jgi:NADPH:quinone reductase-like Zn-dependent oxidoreductase
MRALVFKQYGKPDQIAFADTPRPVPKPDEILVQVHAAGLNPVDNMIPKGTFKPFLRFELPATLGSDLAGVVVEALPTGRCRFRQHLRSGHGRSR